MLICNHLCFLSNQYQSILVESFHEENAEK